MLFIAARLDFWRLLRLNDCEVTSRIQDNCIQLNTFKGELGKKFSIQVTLEDSSITENFEL
ncbi:DUF1822 family protein [Plectonema cf. radiosum LEGE 06105]|uniref:DUF1822 family protein n=1 Tax=Plectonema cf. radiosum LEGE 06105 TaxID=945769 RepID=A0A8J7K1V3_9CYAN|nr:DUF1822 family protein [Plectonema radiosum]MBE9215071.1 DUF1822 family protein [Plectonema cf. radiosum LEGE 06105]